MTQTSASELVIDSKFPLVIELNVGGYHFATSLQTLRRDPNSMLAAMFSERRNSISHVRDNKGAYFIDYDGSCFGIILCYLRDDGSFMVPDRHDLREQVLRCAVYFQVLGLVELIAATVHETGTQLDQPSLAKRKWEGAKATAITTLATVGAFGFRFVIFGLIVPLEN
jgi:hypothetical protein